MMLAQHMMSNNKNQMPGGLTPQQQPQQTPQQQPPQQHVNK
jgi:hypothetical protein